MILPASIIEYKRRGSGNIAETFYHDASGVRLPFVLAGLRVVFLTGSGTGSLVLSTDSYEQGTDWDFPMLTLQSVGAGGTVAYVNLATEHGQEKDWTFHGDPHNEGVTDGLKLAWTDPGTSTWAIKAFLAPLDAVR